MTEEQKAGKIFLFCKESSQERIMKCLRDAFDVPGSAHDTGLELHNGNLNVTLRIYCESAGDEEQELVRSWSDRARGHFSRVETAVVDVKTNLLYQLEGTESIVSVDSVFEGEESEFLTEAEEAAKRNMEQTLFRVLSDLRAVMAFRGEKRGFYCLDASGMEKLILDGNGNSEMERFLPYQAVGYVPGNEIETEQLNRREKNRREFEARGVYVPVFYPLLETEAEADCRTPYEIAARAVALMLVAVFSEAMLAKKMSQKEALEFIQKRINEFGADDFFSLKEWNYLHNEDPKESEKISYSWQYENLYVMEWALGLIDGPLDFPDHFCAVAEAAQLLTAFHSMREILEAAKPRSAKELLDACDMIFCLDWACTDTRMRDLPAPAGMDGGVVFERHKALNWLVGAGEKADWDHVPVDT